MDFKKRFIDIEAGWPGSVGDSRVFALSYLNGIYEDYLSQFVPTPLATGEEADSIIYEDIPAFLLGDSAYANSRHLVTTFKVTECDCDVSATFIHNRREFDVKLEKINLTRCYEVRLMTIAVVTAVTLETIAIVTAVTLQPPRLKRVTINYENKRE